MQFGGIVLLVLLLLLLLLLHIEMAAIQCDRIFIHSIAVRRHHNTAGHMGAHHGCPSQSLHPHQQLVSNLGYQWQTHVRT